MRSKIFKTVDLIAGSRGKAIPPLELRHKLGQDEEHSGEAYVQSLRSLCGLKPRERILDVGSGCGRVALSLAHYLNTKGSYEGLEIVKEFVDWCKKNISSRYPNFQFKHANIYSQAYNPDGIFRASQYKFPYDDESFDVVFLSSVFTHMLPEDLKNYIREISRVMKKNGRCWISYFLLTNETTRVANDSTRIHFVNAGEYYTANRNIPESAIGYDVKKILDLYKKNNLEIVKPIHYIPERQDIIIARKT
jgi:ubiquinone/menaquinone biosynthesis C-methylase UbiE